MNFNYVTGSEFGNRVLLAYERREISLPLVKTVIHQDSHATVTDIEGNPLPTLQAKYEELCALFGPESQDGRGWKKSTENLSVLLN